MPMTPEAKRLLAQSIRGLRARLLDDLHAATESAYRLSIKAAHQAELPEAARIRRGRLEQWIDEQARAESGKESERSAARERLRREVEKRAAYTLLNRLVYLRLLEAAELLAPAVVTGGWDSRAYQDFRQLAPALVRGDESEGYGYLLKLVFAELAVDLPGLFGPAGIAELVPIPPASLRAVVEALDDPALASCWTDDMTLGWVYQYWNDPEREALDAKLNDGGKVEPHEIASKTQMFTERYMVDWLLQNSLGPMWLAMCRKHGWTAEVQDQGSGGQSLLDRLEARRADWRARRERGEVALTELMPLEGEAERRWAYYVPQPIPEDAVAKAPDSVRDIRLLDPACGSGHFLVVALDLLLALYAEEARHRGQAGDGRWSVQACVESILENNLYGVDIDPRAVQIAAAALWLKARQICPDARPGRLGLVASSLKLASLPDDDPALVELRQAVKAETGIPEELTNRIVHALRGADHLGSLLKVDAAVDEAIEEHEKKAGLYRVEGGQGDLFQGFKAQQVSIDFQAARQSIEEQLERFLQRHTGGQDLGLRLRGEQLAAGVRFVRMMREGSYDLVVGNPPYQGTAKMKDAKYVQEKYERGKADLYAAFLEREMQLCREGGVSALLTMRSWMFLKQYAELREWLLKNYDLRILEDLAIGAFDEVPNDLLSVVISIFRKRFPDVDASVAMQPTRLDDKSYDRERTKRKRAAVLCQEGRYAFNAELLQRIETSPVVYWWTEDFLSLYANAPKLGDIAPARFGINTGNNVRFLRWLWEVPVSSVPSVPLSDTGDMPSAPWQRYVKGAAGVAWIDPCDDIAYWRDNGLCMKAYAEHLYGSYSRQIRNESFYFRSGVAFTMLGSKFSGRVHRWRCIIDNKGSSVYVENPAEVVCQMNSEGARFALESLNPSLSFQVGDVNRLPLFPIESADQIYATLDAAFTQHESHREPSIEFRAPGPSPWRYAQDWAQRAVDRPPGAPLPPYQPILDPEPPTDHISYALGIAMGRFGASGEGILDPATHPLSHALPGGILFLDGTREPGDTGDSLGHPAAQPLHAAWSTHGRAIPDIDARTDLRAYLRTRFFADVHRPMYENRPIHWPLCSDKKTFVAYVNIHRMSVGTLRALLAEHLHPTLTRLDGELTDLTAARFGADKKAARAADRRFGAVQKARDELAGFIAKVEECAEKGPPPASAKGTPRQRDARYAPDLDDGVMINSAALWPLLEPQWKDPKKWWNELSSPSGRKDYDWAHLAMRYFPERVDAKCQHDPSLAVAHGCFWRYHPARAWAWELRLQDEIGPEFRITESGHQDESGESGQPGQPDAGQQRAALVAAYLHQHPAEALEAVAKEVLRRARKRKAAQEPGQEPFCITLLEPGLWTQVPGQVWQLELELAKKLGREVLVLAPDEPAERAAYAAEYPSRVSERKALMGSLQLALSYQGDPDGAASGDSDDGGEPDGDHEAEEERDD